MFRPYKIAYQLKHVKVRKAKPFSFLRESVGHLLSESAKTIPHAAMVFEVDVTPLVEYAKATEKDISAQAQEASEKTLFRRAIRRNFSAFFIKTFAHSLYHVPCLNAFLDYSPLVRGGTLYHAEDINISFTVDTPSGVVRPVLHNPHLKSLETVAEEMRMLARKARRTDQDELYRRAGKILIRTALRELDFSGFYTLLVYLCTLLRRKPAPDPGMAKVAEKDKLRPEDVLGATCTVANIGMMVPGIQTVTVIVPPEVFFFGMGDLHLAPRVVDGNIVPRSVMSFMGTMDHRAFDAGEAFPFWGHFKSYIDNPGRIYEWKPGDQI
ncbi:MAG: 2-oxo acid dehydrogenase subunit E2 [Pseudomonadota bacterium]